RMDCQSHLHQIGIAVMQYFDDWNGQFFLHHPFNADVLSETAKADSFAEIYWEDKIMPYVNQAYADERIANRGTQVADEKIYRCMSDISVPTPFKGDDGVIDGIGDRTSYLMNSLLSHKTQRYGRWSFVRFQNEIGTSNFIAFSERDAAGLQASPYSGGPGPDDYDIWLGSGVPDTSIALPRARNSNRVF